MLSRAHAPKTGKLEFDYNLPRARGGWCSKPERGNGEPDEPFRPCDLHACHLTRALFPSLLDFSPLLIIASKRTQRVNTPPRTKPALEFVRLALALIVHAVRRKRAHLGGAGGEPPAVLVRLLVLADKCFEVGHV